MMMDAAPTVAFPPLTLADFPNVEFPLQGFSPIFEHVTREYDIMEVHVLQTCDASQVAYVLDNASPMHFLKCNTPEDGTLGWITPGGLEGVESLGKAITDSAQDAAACERAFIMHHALSVISAGCDKYGVSDFEREINLTEVNRVMQLQPPITQEELDVHHPHLSKSLSLSLITRIAQALAPFDPMTHCKKRTRLESRGM